MDGSAQRAALLPASALWRMAGFLTVVALATLWLGHATDIDLALADAVFDPGRGAFPWRHAWLTEVFGHSILKQLMLLLALGVIGAAALDLLKSELLKPALLKLDLRRDGLDRLRLRIVALAALAVPTVIGALKQLSSSHCPWDLLRYGGAQPYLHLFEALPDGAMPGQCLPAGHASSALWLVALAVYWLPASPARAGRVALLALMPGALLGGFQQLRGAHFMTHTLWSIWIACALVLALVATLQARPRRQLSS